MKKYLSLLFLFPMLLMAQAPPIMRSVLTTNIPAFGSPGQLLARMATTPFLMWTNVSGADAALSNYVNQCNVLISNYVATLGTNSTNFTLSIGQNGTNYTLTIGGYSTNYTLSQGVNSTNYASNLVFSSTNGQFIPVLNGTGTNTTFKQVLQTGPALTVGTNSGATFSIMGITNGPSPYLVQIGSPMLASNSGGTNAFLMGTNGNMAIGQSSLSYKLNVWGDILIGEYNLATTTPRQLIFGDYQGSGTCRPSFVYNSPNNWMGIGQGDTTANCMRIGTVNSPANNWPSMGTYAGKLVFDYSVYGFSTNTPQAAVHIRGNPTNQYLLRADASNALSRLTLDTNGNLVVAGTITATNGITVFPDQAETGNALTIGTNSGATFSIMGVTNGPSKLLVQMGSPYLSANVGGTNVFVVNTNGYVAAGKAFCSPVIYTFTSTGDGTPGSSYSSFQPSSLLFMPNSSDKAIQIGGYASSAWLQFLTDDTRVRAVIMTNGLFGIGTNQAQAQLHVVASNIVANALRVDSMQQPGIMLLNTNGNLSVSGTLTATNGAYVGTQMLTPQPLGLYGSMMFNTTNYGQAFGATYTNIKGMNIWVTNQFTVNTNTGYITNLIAGYYRCGINVSMLGQNGATYEGCMLTNDVDPETIGFYHTHDNPARYRSASGMGIIYLPANTGCSFALKADTAGTIQIRRGSITIGTP